MNPKKVKFLLPELAVENKEDMALLQKLHTFYWNKVRETLSTTDHLKVKIINLGVFTRKSWSLDKMIEKKVKMFNALENTSRVAVRQNLQKDIEHLKRVKAFQEVEKLRKDSAKLKRDEYNQTLEKS